MARHALGFRIDTFVPIRSSGGSHPFGIYRVQLGSGLRAYQNLLEGIGVREKPDFNDAIEVLISISKEVGSEYSKRRTRMSSFNAGSCCPTR